MGSNRDFLRMMNSSFISHYFDIGKKSSDTLDAMYNLVHLLSKLGLKSTDLNETEEMMFVLNALRDTFVDRD
jgi:hypothetical protein